MQNIGYILYVLAAIDFISANFLGVDFTGVWWSAIVLAVVGGFFVNAGSSSTEDKEDLDN